MRVKRETITLVGAGLAGSLLAVFLARRGFRVEVYEKRPDIRRESAGAGSAGRSINLAMSVRGLHALHQVGLKDEVLGMAIPMTGRLIHPVEGEQVLQPYGQRDEEVIYSVSRGELNRVLVSAAERQDGVRFHFNARCTGVEFRTGVLYIRDDATNHVHSLRPRRIIGVDGSASAIRTAMMNAGRFDLSQQYLTHGYKELTIPAGPDGAYRMAPNALHIWPRGLYMLIALPNLDGSFTCTLFFPHEGEYSFDSLLEPEQVLDFFGRQFPDATALMPDLATLYRGNPTGSLVTLKCFPWHYRDRVLLLGDAAHAIVPFFGQGMNCAFEDCTVLDECIEAFWPDWGKVFEAFGQRRKENTDAIADMALANYVEMRDLVSDPGFQLRQKVGFLLEQKFPEVFIPRYSMVSFHRFPYSEALHRGEIQDGILRELCASVSSEEQVDWNRAGRLVRERLGAH